MKEIRESALPIDICKITVGLKGKMATAEPSNTIKLFYHPLSVVAKGKRQRLFYSSPSL